LAVEDSGLEKFGLACYNRHTRTEVVAGGEWFGKDSGMARRLREYLEVILRPEEVEGRLDFAGVFGRTGPVHIEVGSGKGTFLVNQARAHPKIDFLGIEWARKYYRYAVDRMGRWGLKNVRLIRADAAVFLAENIGNESVECFHIYFPDPWPKKRHHKRRFINDANLGQMLRCLKRGGTIRVASDHLDYFEHIKEVLTGRAGEVEEVDFLPTAGADTGEWVGTNFERKYLKEGRGIYAIAVRKV
jgi:tRNA (guanine-N7-)-methyltransferase